MRFLTAALLICLALSGVAQAQDGPASLIADRVRLTGSSVIVADGNVEILFGDTRLRASRITYDRVSGRLDIEGPITLVEGDRVVILASSASLDADLRNGILTSARAVLDDQLQLAANEIRRVDGRYTQFTKTIASSCQVCASNPVPLWSIRASRIVHDTEERQLYFDNATFRVGRVPIMWLPRLRLPDPTLRRATGFLIPDLRTTSQLGTGVKIPYFIAIGDSRDLTFTPYVSSHTRTMELRYRQAFTHGKIEFKGAVSSDDILPGESRAYLFGNGSFTLPRDYHLNFDVELTSDPAYLLDYGYSDKDRLDSAVELWRVRRHSYFSAGLINYRTLRASEIPFEDQLPYLVGEVVYERRYLPEITGGEAQLRFSMQGHQRTSTTDILGRDVLRLGVSANWARDWTLRNGMVAEVQGRVTADAYTIGQDSTYAVHSSRVTPSVGATLRWPFSRTGGRGATQIIEPLAQVAYSDVYGADVPNEDSGLVEFDEANLLSLQRFPGRDRSETGGRAALGVSWTRYDPAGWSMGVVLGRVFRQDPALEFSEASGLNGQNSDWLTAVHFRMGPQLSLVNRTLFTADLSGVTKSETRLAWAGERLTAASSYIWIIPDLAENRPDRVNELTLDTAYKFTRHWTGSADMRFDIDAGRAASAGLGLAYRNECVTFDLYLSRRFTSSISVTPTTNVGLKVSLNGFGNDGRAYRRACHG